MADSNPRRLMSLTWLLVSMLIAFLPLILVQSGLFDETIWIYLWLQVAIGVVFVQLTAAMLRDWPKSWLRETLAFCTGTIGGTLWVMFTIYFDLFVLPQYIGGLNGLTAKFFGSVISAPASVPGGNVSAVATSTTNPAVVWAISIPSAGALAATVIFVVALLKGNPIKISYLFRGHRVDAEAGPRSSDTEPR